MLRKLPIYRIAFAGLLCFALASGLQAQKHQFGARYTAPNYILGLGDVPSPLEGIKTFGGGLEFEYQRRLTPNLLLGVPIRLTSAEAIKNPADADLDPVRPNVDLVDVAALGADLQLVFEPIAKASVFDPQLFAGIGLFSDLEGNAIPEVPLGVNLNFNLGKGVYLSPQLSYRLALGDYSDVRTNVQAGLGAHIQIGADGKDKMPKEPAVIDTDGDGIEDSRDRCPTEAGPASTIGCPDTDGDGVANKDDKCPDVAGISALQGCPDADGDGVTDGEDECPTEAGPASNNGCPVTDSDGDGVPNSKDQCPNEAGPASNNGCPIADADGDGIPDSEDKCPNQAGSKATMGCPDGDNDGIADRDDRCPNQAGPASSQGCPDTDGDGVVDIDDKCPTQVGPASNQGCPEISKEDRATIDFAIQNINFETASAVITSDSRAVLDKVEDILRRYPAYQLAIGGHTDSIGSAESNMRLSKKRAKSVYDYLIGKGISARRLTHEGFGETVPIADNRYKDGREQNRRVTLDLVVQ